MTQITVGSNLIDFSAYGLSSLITPEALGAKGDGDPSHNDLPYIQEALNSGAKIVYCPGKYYCDGEGQLVIPDGVQLIANYRNTLINPSEATFQINAYKGVYDKTLGFFKMGIGSAVRNINAFYPEQTKTDNRSSIVEFPPLFYCNNYGGIIDGVNANKVYSFLEGDAMANIDMANVHAFCVYRGIQLFGHIGDVSGLNNVEMVMNGGVAWGTDITDWCQRNAIGLSLVPEGSNRIDGLFLSNFYVIGGWKGLYANGSVWLQMSGFAFDECTCPLDWHGGYLTGGNGWLSHSPWLTQAGPLAKFTSGLNQLNGCRLAADYGSNANIVFNSGTAETQLNSCQFSSSQAGRLVPAAFNNSSGWLSLNNCHQYGPADGAQAQPLTFVDVVGANIQIDGVATPPVGADITPANFNMQTWASRKPNNWVSSVTPGIEDSYFQELHPITGDYGVQISSINIGQFALSYVMPAAVNDLPGYYWLAFDIRIVDPTNDTQCLDGFSFTYGYALDMYKPFWQCGLLSWAGASALTTGIPRNEWVPVKMLVCAPPEASKLRLSVQRWDTINLPVQFRNFQWFASGDLPRNLSGNEYFSGQIDSVDPGGGVVYRTQARDILVNGKWNLLRAWTPANGKWHIGDKVKVFPSRASGVNEILRISDGSTNNFYTDWSPGPMVDHQQVVNYSASIQPDISLGNIVFVNCSGHAAITINQPLNILSNQKCAFDFLTDSNAVTITWGAGIKAATTSLNANKRTIVQLTFDGSYIRQIAASLETAP